MTETSGDKELVIGNRQLISLFFVVVALCGVFFAMGYMIGRNSTRTVIAAETASVSPAPTGQRQQPEPPRETAASSPESGAASGSDQPAPPPASTAPDPAVHTRPAETRPAQDSLPVSARPEPPATEGVKVVKAAAGASAVSAPEAGASYLQVTALPRADADGIVRTLREQNFPTILATSSKDGLYRVLVGPYHQTSQLADAKARLKAIGFGSAFVQKQ